MLSFTIPSYFFMVSSKSFVFDGEATMLKSLQIVTLKMTIWNRLLSLKDESLELVPTLNKC